MRILRLYAPSLIGDHTLCYVHANSSGDSCVNEVPIEITCASAGTDLTSEDHSDKMTIVLPPDSLPSEGDFVSVDNGRYSAQMEH